MIAFGMPYNSELVPAAACGSRDTGINAHDVWVRERLAQDWTYGAKRDDARKHHPCLVPYADLPESEKVHDRNAAMQTLKAVIALGYRLTRE